MCNGKTNDLLMWQLNGTKHVERTWINEKGYNSGCMLTNMIGPNWGVLVTH